MFIVLGLSVYRRGELSARDGWYMVMRWGGLYDRWCHHYVAMRR